MKRLILIVLCLISLFVSIPSYANFPVDKDCTSVRKLSGQSQSVFSDNVQAAITSCEDSYSHFPAIACWNIPEMASVQTNQLAYIKCNYQGDNLCEDGMITDGGSCAPPACGVDDGKTQQQCDCEEAGNSYSSSLGECFVSNPPQTQQECEANGGTFGQFNGQDTCVGDQGDCSETETRGFVNGVETCIAADYGPPDCDFNTVATYSDSEGGSGFSCSGVSSGDDSDQDTDGDGEPDATDNDIDGDGTPNATDNDVDGDGTPNESDPDYGGSSVDNSGIESGLADITDAQEDTNQELQNMNLKLLGIDDNIAELKNYVTEEPGTVADKTGTVATIEETSQRISNAIYTQPFIASVMTVPSMTTNNDCPTFTFPANKFWSAITMNIHCVILEEQRTALSILFTGLWSIMGVFVFLKA